MEKKWNPLQTAILTSWKKTRLTHPSYGEIAKELGCSAHTVYKTVQIFKLLNNSDDITRKPKKGQRDNKRKVTA